jgi:hypothetical protein
MGSIKSKNPSRNFVSFKLTLKSASQSNLLARDILRMSSLKSILWKLLHPGAQ